MKKRDPSQSVSMKYTFVSVILVMAIFFSPVAPAIRLHQVTLLWEKMISAPTAQAEGPENSTLYLPIAITAGEADPLGAPAFEIISPASGGTISGVMYFAVQPTDAATVSSVSFKAGSTDLGTDSDGSDGFKVFLNASDLPAGTLELSAIGTGVSGETTKRITVNVVPNPPSSATVGSEGGVLASEIGSIITLPPDAVPDGTNISVTEMTQEEITAQNGFDWDAMGVTFLGAQNIQSNADISKPLGVASAGFGNRVQPGQAVVNYRIVPDADGDGVDELVVVNTASVAPNNDVISDPVPQIQLGSATTTSRSKRVTTSDLRGGLSGGIGTLLEIEASGFNPASIYGNVATFRSLVDGSEVELPAFVQPDIDDDGLQTIFVPIPNLPVGAATLTLRNESTSSTVGPLNLIIEAAPSLSQSPEIIIDETLVLADNALNELATLIAKEGISLPIDIATAQSQLSEVRTYFQELSTDPTPEEQQILNTFAVMIENSSIVDLLTVDGRSLAPDDTEQGIRDLATGVGLLAAYLVATGTAPLLAAILTGITIGAFLGLALAEFFPFPFNRGGTTGMGAALPSGGNGAGNCLGRSSGNLRNPSGGGFGLEPGRFVIKLLSGGSLTPFSGVTDAGGYFFIPFIPEAEPFTALAIDTVTGEQRRFEGVGPPFGESVFMFFDFLSEGQAAGTPIEMGDVVNGEISEAGELDIYSFSAQAGQQVYFDGQETSASYLNLHWRLLDPQGTEIFSRGHFGDSGPYTLDAGGTYTLLVFGEGNTTSTYQFQLWNVPPPDEFTINIGDVISDSNPGAGAGNIESPGVSDIYHFEATPSQQVYFDAQETSASYLNVNWRLLDPQGTPIFRRGSFSDAGTYTLETGGTYTLSVFGEGTITTTYQFQLWNVPPPDEFTINIGDVVSDSNPGAGAGNIETPGVTDIYHFEAIAGQQVYFDAQETSASYLDVYWRLVDPQDSEIFSLGHFSDAGTYTLETGGTYRLFVYGERDATSTYSFQLFDVPPPDEFTINIGDVVSDGVPGVGAGNIESPGRRDIYTFQANAGQQVYFDVQQSDFGRTRATWSLTDETGTQLFDGFLGDVDVQTLAQGGTYTLIVDARGDNTGTYSFQIIDQSQVSTENLAIPISR